LNPPKMPIHIGDYKRDTGHLRAAGHGAYLLLLFHHWSTGELPQDDDQLASIACMTRGEWKKARPIIERFFKSGWRHGRVEEDLAAAHASYEKRAKAGEKGGKAKAEAKQCSSNATALPQQPLTLLTLDQSKKDSEANASAADAAPAKHPVYTDSRHELWGEGIPILEQLGISERSARSNIGRWLKDTADDAQAVLGAIQRARDSRAHNAIPWITNALRTPNGQRSNHSNRKSPGGDFFAGLAEVAAGLDRDGAMAGPADENIPSGRVNIEH
jgi:uncharacterized protein YdaU (DUF1376 family)